MSDDPSVVASRASGPPPTGSINAVHGMVSGIVLQAGAVHGDVHLHAPTGISAAVPRQLPIVTRHFVGRLRELRALTQIEETSDESNVVVICGTAGVGKTSLAIHWAHQVVDKFADGELYVDMQGYSDANLWLHPSDAVRMFLDAFEVSSSRMPIHLDARLALFRTLIANRRLLLVLDNVRDAGQVRLLLPGGSSCLTIITSRDQLLGLVAEGARSITLDVLSLQEGAELVVRRLGAERSSADPDAVDELVRQCARLPLALGVAVARAHARPSWPLTSLVRELRDGHTRLEGLDIGDPQMNLRSVFLWSYRALEPDVARMFRLVGVHPGPDIDVVAAASLAAVPLTQARQQLIALTRAHLLEEHVPGRFRFHDLLRSYSAERLDKEESIAHQQEAAHRMLDYYLHRSFEAERRLYPHRDRIALASPRTGVVEQHIDDYEHAMTWFIAERGVLLAVVDYAARNGFHVHAWQLPWSLATFIYRQGHWIDYMNTQRTAAAAADALGDRLAQAISHRLLGHAFARLNRYDEAVLELGRALELERARGDQDGEARTHRFLAWVNEWQDQYSAALDHVQQALDLWRATGHQAGEAEALESVGWCHAQLGDYSQSLVFCEQALALHRALDDRTGEAIALDSIGFSRYHRGEDEQALTTLRQALAIWRELGDRYREASTLKVLGDTHDVFGRRVAALSAWEAAFAILDELDHPDADLVRARCDQPQRGEQ